MNLKLFGFALRPGRRTIREVKVAEFPDGSPISLLIRAVSGEKVEPVVTMMGVQHGDEYNGMEIINRLMDELRPRRLTGTVIAIPVSNPVAFNSSGRMASESMGYENLNMNRVWPGDMKGLLTEKIAATIWENVIIGSDSILDFHEGGKAFLARYIHARTNDEVDKLVGSQIKKLYQLFGQGIPVLGGVRTRGPMIGSLTIQAGLRGIPCIGPELGGGGRIQEDLAKVGVQGAKNIMIGLGLLREEPVGANGEQIVAEESSWPKTKHGGIVYNTCELGQTVEEGRTLGILKDTAGRMLEEICAPYRSVIFDVRYQPTLFPGDWTYHCGKIT